MKKKNDEDTGLLLTRANSEQLSGLLYFKLTYDSDMFEMQTTPGAKC